MINRYLPFITREAYKSTIASWVYQPLLTVLTGSLLSTIIKTLIKHYQLRDKTRIHH